MPRSLTSLGHRNRAFAACTLGVVAAASVFELGLRPFVAGWNQPAGAVRTVRSYIEGFSVAHFEADGLGTFGNRLTGNPPLASAPEGLILGDSHVIAQAVRDEQTIGAVVERLSRSAGRPLNVRQYGWSSANAPTFLGAAPSLLRARRPAWVAVVFNPYNLGANALTTTQNWRIEIAPDDSFRLIDMRSPPVASRLQTIRRRIGRSALALGLWRRWGETRNRGSEEERAIQGAPAQSDPNLAAQAARLPRIILTALKKAYGSRLIIVYTPEFFGTHYDSTDQVEREVLRLCSENGIACLSMRDALARERYQHSRLSRGFHNTAPGEGHFNATGCRIIGEEIWRLLSARSSPT